MCVHECACACACTRTRTCTCIRARTRTRTYTRAYTHLQTHEDARAHTEYIAHRITLTPLEPKRLVQTRSLGTPVELSSHTLISQATFMSCMKESCHTRRSHVTYEGVMSDKKKVHLHHTIHILHNQVVHMNKSHHTFERVMSEK